jgi:CheY-like chemotaxis protein
VGRLPDGELLDDLSMPGEDGVSFIRHVRTFSAIPALALSGHARDSDRAATIAAGFDAQLSKPMAIEELTRVIARLCKRA